jgi:hypothetical protein
VADHTAVAVRALGDEGLVAATLDDHRAAPIGDKLRAILDFLEKLNSGDVGPADVAPLRVVGLDDDAIASALYVAFVFDVMDRLADAFAFEVNHARGLKWVARILLRFGYRTGVVPG